MQVGVREQELGEARQQEREVLLLAFTQFKAVLCRGHAALAAVPAPGSMADGAGEGPEESTANGAATSGLYNQKSSKSFF